MDIPGSGGASIPLPLSVAQGGLGNTTGDASGLSVSFPGLASASLANRVGRIIDAKLDFGVKADGTTDDTAALQAFFSYMAANGGMGTLPSKGVSPITGRIFLNAAAKAFAIVGPGNDQYTIKRASNFNASIMEVDGSANFLLADFSLDGGNALYPNGNHGLVFADCDYATARRIKVRNQLNSGILMYATSPYTHTDNIADNCLVDGKGVANNGILAADLDHSGLINCYAVGCPGSPGYGLQLKNRCRWSFIDGGYAEACGAGIAFGNADVVGNCVQYSRVRGVITRNCQTAFGAGQAFASDVDVAVADCGDTTNPGNGVDLQACIGVTVTVHQLLNVSTAGKAVILRSGTTDCYVTIDELNNDSGSAGNVVAFLAGSDRNTVRLKKTVNPTSIGSITTVYANGGGTGNQFIYDPQAPLTGTVAQVADGSVTYGQSRGTGAVDFQVLRAAANRVAGGSYSCVLFGSNCAGFGTTSLAGGDNNVAGALGSVALGGGNNAAGGAYSTVIGGLYADTRNTFGAWAYSSGRFSVAGDAQSKVHILRAAATDATPTRLTSDGAAASTTNSVPLPTGAAYRVRGSAVAHNTSTGDTAGWDVTALLKKVGGTLTLLGSTITKDSFSDTAASNWTLAITADNTNKAVGATATGASGIPLRTVLRLDSVEVL